MDDFRMPNIDNDKSTRVLSQKLRKSTIYIWSIKSVWTRGRRMVHLKGRLLYISPRSKRVYRRQYIKWQLVDTNKYRLILFSVKARDLMQRQLT
jgi:hypothetical protein